MSYIKDMFASHPVEPESDRAVAIECITACYSCAEACNASADACLGEKNVADLVSCIRTDQDCADVCLTTAKIVSRLTATDRDLVGGVLRACIEACRICGSHCQKHAGSMDHCRVCAEACERCAKACEALLAE
ncbi:MAG: four-helix bundle copper-binding protein [Chthoniobacterales bacterium]